MVVVVMGLLGTVAAHRTHTPELSSCLSPDATGVPRVTLFTPHATTWPLSPRSNSLLPPAPPPRTPTPDPLRLSPGSTSHTAASTPSPPHSLSRTPTPKPPCGQDPPEGVSPYGLMDVDPPEAVKAEDGTLVRPLDECPQRCGGFRVGGLGFGALLLLPHAPAGRVPPEVRACAAAAPTRAAAGDACARPRPAKATQEEGGVMAVGWLLDPD